MAKVKDITGQHFGSLTVKARAPGMSPQGQAIWVCSCACGNETIVRGYSLRHGDTKSCGCRALRNLRKLRNKNGNPYPNNDQNWNSPVDILDLEEML